MAQVSDGTISVHGEAVVAAVPDEIGSRFEAQTSVDVRIDDASIAGRLIQGAVDGAGAYVDGPWWHLHGDNPARTEACAAAARDARRKAEAYADALGVRLGEVRSVTESAAPVGPAPRMLAAGARGAATEGIELDPTLDVTADVTITYGIDGDVARRA